MDDKQKSLEKEIDLIQKCIERMAKNSFIVKGWAISLASVILALLPKNIDIRILSLKVVKQLNKTEGYRNESIYIMPSNDNL